MRQMSLKPSSHGQAGKPAACHRASTAVHRRATVVCRAQQVSAPAREFNPLLMGAVDALFKFPPFFNAAVKKARGTIANRAKALGLDWDGAMRDMKAEDWEGRMKAIAKPGITYPEYYTQPFHAYSKGNLCLEAAMEMTMAAQSVHAIVMDPAGKQLDPQGDSKLRSSYSARIKENLTDLGIDPETRIRDIVDFGCATGLSSLELLRAFPGAHVTGVDLSPHHLAVGQYEQERRVAANGGVPERLTLVHGLAEATGLPPASVDMVSMCLVCHELPQEPTKAIMREAFRILRPGGVMCIMEMNPASSIFRRIFSNPFAYTAFKSTEPWLQEYIALDMPGALREAGFAQVLTRESTPRHKTVTALKR